MSDMTQSFIEMVEAYKAKPELEAQIKTLGEDNAMCYKTIDQLRYEIELLKSDKTDLATKLSEVTRERDDASFRNLELDEKISGIEKLLGMAERVEQARREEHQATVDAMTPKPVEDKPTESPDDPGMAFHAGPIDPVVVEPQGQSVVDPTPVPASDPVTSGSAMEDGGASPAPTAPSNTPSEDWDEYNPTHYRGRPYSQKPWWVNASEWHDAGGLMD